MSYLSDLGAQPKGGPGVVVTYKQPPQVVDYRTPGGAAMLPSDAQPSTTIPQDDMLFGYPKTTVLLLGGGVAALAVLLVLKKRAKKGVAP